MATPTPLTVARNRAFRIQGERIHNEMVRRSNLKRNRVNSPLTRAELARTVR